jgi:hypothetical protein
MKRRQLISTLVAAGLVPASTHAADSVFEGLPLIALNEGRWDGTYRFMRPDGVLLDSYEFRIRVSLSRENAKAYRQESHYRWDDGRTLEMEFEASYADGRLHWDNGRINGSLWEISDNTIYLRFGFNAQPGLVCHEMIQITPDGQQRGRTWLWYQDGRLERYTLIDERRVADDSPLAWS